jgi:F-type H+-transporting ATPase subunit beta
VRKDGYTLGVGGVNALFFIGDGAPSRDAFDTVIALSTAVAALKIYPAVDPLASGSRWLAPEIVGAEHTVVAARARRCLEAAAALQEREDLDDAARLAVARARKLQRFFSQPFFVAEPYTKTPGTFVPRAEALAACASIVDGEHDDVPEQAFSFVGGIDDVLARATPKR